MNRQLLKHLINKEITRLSDNHDKDTVHLINNILKPMLVYIEDHNRLIAEIARISGKHIT